VPDPKIKEVPVSETDAPVNEADNNEPICPLAVVLLCVSAGIILDRFIQPVLILWVAVFCLAIGGWFFSTASACLPRFFFS
jgi:hypothetical protein